MKKTLVMIVIMSVFTLVTGCTRPQLKEETQSTQIDRLITRARNSFHRFQFVEGRRSLEDAIDLASVLDNKHALMIAYNELGIAAYKQGKYVEAANAFNKALSYRTVPSAEELIIYDNIGRAYTALGNYTEARKHYELAKEFTTYPYWDYEFSQRIQLHIAELYFYEGKLDDARASVSDVLENSRSASNKGLAQYVWGLIERKEGKTDSALEHFNEAMKGFAAAEDILGLTQTRIQLGGIALEKNELNIAQDNFENVLKAGEFLDNVPFKRTALVNLIQIALRQNNPDLVTRYNDELSAVNKSESAAQ